MAELAYALDLGSSRETCGGSIPPSRNSRKHNPLYYILLQEVIVS